MTRNAADDGDTALSRPSWRWLASVPTTVWAVTALWVSLLFGASLLWPMTYGYDESQHIDMAYAYSVDPSQFYAPGQLLPAQATVNMQNLVPGHPPHKALATAPTRPRGERPSLAQLGGHTSSRTAQPNQMVQHPPLYYWAEAVVLRFPGVSHLAWDKQVWLMRLLSVLFMIPIPILCWAAAGRMLSGLPRLTGASQYAVVAAVVPLTIPNLIRIGSSVTNESLLILAASAVLYLACRVMTGDLNVRTSIGLGIVLAVALLTKGAAFVLVPIVLAAYMLGAARAESGERSRIRVLWPALIAPAIGCLIGGVWWLRNLRDFGHVAVNGFGSAYERVLFGRPTNNGQLTVFLPRYLDVFVKRIWGGIGLPDDPLNSPLLVFGWFGVVLIGVVASVFMRTGQGSQARALVLAAGPLLAIILATTSSYVAFHKWPGTARATQSHYVYFLVLAVSVLTAMGWLGLLQTRAWRWLVPICIVGAVITNAAAWLVVLSRWYKPPGAPALGGYADAVHGLFRWSPVPVPVTAVLVCILPVVTSVAVIVAAFRWASPATPLGADFGDGATDDPEPDAAGVLSDRASR